MELLPHQLRVLDWITKHPWDSTECAAELGLKEGSCRTAKSFLQCNGLIRTAVEVTPAGQALLQKE